MRHGHDIGPLRAERKVDARKSHQLWPHQAWPDAPWLSLAALALALAVTAPVAEAQQTTPEPGTPAPATSAGNAASAVQALLDQARYWRQHGRPDLVSDAMQRVYALAPQDPAVIYQLGTFAAEDGDTASAKGWLAHLRRVAPGDGRAARLEASLRQSAVPAAGIEEARRLAQSGDAVGAVALYRRLFGDGPPPDAYALEYYQTLAGTPDGFDTAQRGLGILAARDPNGDSGLAYARVLTYREPTRRQGIALLSRRGDAGARAAWRQALLWLDAKPADKPLYDAYMATAPDDGAVAGHFAEATAPAARDDGFAALDAGDSRLAEQRFRARLAEKPDDAEALGGLGILRLRAGDYAGARDYLTKAIKADPAKRGQWASALSSAQYLGTMAAAKRARDGGKLEEAERLVTPLAQGQGRQAQDARLLLGDIQRRRGRLQAAEATYRAVLAADPGQRDALTALYTILLKQNRTAEAQAIAARLPAGQAGGLGDIRQAQASALRARAEAALAAGDTVGARADLETALANSPNDPWVRLDLARLLAAGGEHERARALIDEMAAATGAKPEALHAAALFAAEQGQFDQVTSLLARVPARARTAEMKALAERAEIEGDLGRAKAAALSGDTVGAQATLRALYARAGSLSVEQRGQVAIAMIDAGDAALALGLARQDTQGTLKGPATRYAGHVGVMARVGLDAEALSFLRRLEQTPGVDRGGVARLNAVVAAARGDRLREAGLHADSYDVIAMALSITPDDADLLAALARLYDAGGMHGEAMSVYNRLLALKPGDQDVLRGAIGAAIGAGDTDTAATMLSNALARAPGDPELHMLAARLAQARGDTGTAIEALRNARLLRERQLGHGTMPGAPSIDPVVAPPTGMPGNPFRRSSVSEGPPAAIASPGLGRATPPLQVTMAPAPNPAPAPAPARYAAAMPETAMPETAVPETAMPETMAPVRAPAMPVRVPTPATASAGQTSGGLYLPGGEVRRLPGAPEYATPVQAPEAVVAPVAQPATITPPAYPAPAYVTPTYATPTYTPPASVVSPYGLPAPTVTAQAGLPAGSYPGYPPAVVPATVTDPVTQEIDRQLADLRRETVAFVRGDVGLRSRDGEAGLSRLTEIRGDFSGSVSPFGTGRLTLTATPVHLDSGTPEGDGARRFATNPLVPTDVTASNHTALASIVSANSGVWNLLTTSQKEILGAAITTPEATLLSDFVTANPTLVATLTTATQDAITAALGADPDTLLTTFYAANTVDIENALTTAQKSILNAALVSDVYSFDSARLAALRRTPTQESSGVGLKLAYDNGPLKLDVGTSPLGFAVENIIGGATWSPQLSDTTQVAITAERRPVTDSMLSYAGTEEPYSGQKWGGVTRTGGRVMLSSDDGDVGLYAGGAYYTLKGENVADNTQMEATVGAYFRPYRTATGELKVGANLSYLDYDRNLGEFSFGHGGYFSPQNFFSMAIPVDYEGQTTDGRWKYTVGGAVGYQSYDKEEAPYFPTDPALQGIMDQEAAAGLVTASTYAGSSESGFGANLHGSFDYAVDSKTFVGGSASFDSFGDFSESSVMFYVKRLLDGFGP